MKKVSTNEDQAITFSPDLFIIPSAVMLDHDLQPLDSKVYATVYWLERLRDGKCFASNLTISKVVNSSSSGVRQSLYRLESKGYISMIYDENNHRKNINTLVQMRGGVSNETGGVSEMRHRDNNTKKEEYTSEMVEQIQKVYKAWLVYMIVDPEVRFHGDADSRSTALKDATRSYRLTDKRRVAIARRLKDSGYERVMRAIKSISQSDFHRGINDTNWTATMEWLLKSYEKVEEWANKFKKEGE